MPVHTCTCVTLTCDVCSYRYDEDEVITHFVHVEEARACTHDQDWIVSGDLIVICGLRDSDHQEAIDALLPPEPSARIPGQTTVDGAGAS